LSGDPAQQYVSDGITEDIITELARFRGLSVAARHASFHHAGKGKALAEVAQQLGVGFVVEGSVRKLAERIRITAQLIEARTGNHVWAERYDRDSRDIFAIQDQVVASIVSMLEDRMVATEAAIARSKPTSSWSAYDCLLQGRDLCNRYREPESIPFFLRATALDPDFALAHAWLAIALNISDFVALDYAQVAAADRASKRALELDANDATSQWARALFLFWTGELDQAQRYFERAMLLNPADIQIRGDFSNWQRASGKPAEALTTLDDALRLGPFVPIWFGAIRGHTLFDLKRYSEAVQALEPLPPHYSSGSLYLAAAYAYMGDDPAAARVVAMVRQRTPDLSLRHVARVILYKQADARQHFLEGLRKAGLPE
jgi:adenylate cyclase